MESNRHAGGNVTRLGADRVQPADADEAEHTHSDLEPQEARSLEQMLRTALTHTELRLNRLASDAISRARFSKALFAQDDFPRLRKVAEVGDAANRLYAAALLLALTGNLEAPDPQPLAA